MRQIFLVILAVFQLSYAIRAQSRDTVLNMVISKPNFYNLVKNDDGKIFAGTSEGIIEINGINLSQHGSTVGYLTLDKMGEPVIDSNGVRFHSEKTLSHLLPYPEMAREEYHISTENTLYICSGGRLYIFDILPYEYSYPNHSIRTISKDMLGTYSGIYLNGKKLTGQISGFVDGYIRQFGNRAFICNYELMVLEIDALDSGSIKLGKNCFAYVEPTKQFINDVYPSPDKEHFYIATKNKLILADYNLSNDTILYSSIYDTGPIGLVTNSNGSLIFFDNNELLRLTYTNGEIVSLIKLNEPIISGEYIGKQIYLITTRGLYRYNTNQQIEKLMDIEKAHSLVALGESDLVISTDHGLYLYNIVNRSLSVIIKGIEFNRRALYKNEKNIFAGSINGLYTINIVDIPKLIENYKAQLNKANRIYDLLGIIIGLVSIFIFLGFIAFRLNKKLKAAEKKIESISSPKEEITREKVENFILNNLPNASIKTIMDEFKLNGKQLYVILRPDRPGSIIQSIRLEKLKKMREENKTNHEISEVTGLSVSYLKKLKG
jgi:ligand-binding sensor domain-containing protein